MQKKIEVYVFLFCIAVFIIISCTPAGTDAGSTITRSGGKGGEITEYHSDHISIYFTSPPDDPALDDALIEMINRQSVSQTMEVCFYGLNRENVIQAIEAAIQRGVHVRFVGNKDSGEDYYDGYLRIAQALDAEFGGSRASDIEGDYADFKLTCSAIMHNKFVIVTDSTGQQYLYMGTTNCTDTGFEANNNNSIIFTDNGIADHYRSQFEYLLGVSSSEVSTVESFVIDGNTIDVLFAPNILGGQTAMDYLMSAAGNASSSIHFMIFSFPYMPLNSLMLDKHDAGLDVMGVVDFSQLNNCAEEYLAQHGLPIRIDGNYYTTGGHGGKLHHKTMIIDSQESDGIVVTGSFNWSNNANENNDENMIFIHSQEIAEFYENEFTRVWSQGTEVDTVTNIGDDAAYQDIIISEVMWMGSRLNDGTSTYSEEFIELKNMTANQVDLSGWAIRGAAMSQKPIVLPEGSEIQANSYLVIMNEAPASGVYAYNPPLYLLHGQVAVTNTGITLILEDPDRTVIDYAGNGSDGEDFSGLNGSGSEGNKMSMARKVPAGDGREQSNWFTSSLQVNIDSNYTDHTYGSPGADNISGGVSYSERDIIISEVAWAGTDTSANDEWIELYNRSGSDITFDAEWSLDTADGGLNISLVGKTILSNSYLLLERTDDSTVPGKTADIIYTGSLSNGGDQIVLLYNDTEIDVTPSTWSGGSSSPRITMLRSSLNADGELSTSWTDGSGDVEGAQASGD